MSDLAVTGDYFDEPVDEEIVNGPNIRKTPNAGNWILESGVLEHNLPENIVAY